jgi:cellulose synthase/poly-beta-1,6-N-acetylglucosamine synthase-like glycosyltransferase
MSLQKTYIGSEEKKIQPALLIATAAFCALSNAYFLDKYVQVIFSRPNWAGKATVTLIILWIVLTSFYAGFHLMSFSFSLAVRKWGNKAVRDYLRTPAVAIFYPCMNDLKTKAIEACLAQDYPNFALFILDDSSTEAERARVEAVRRRHSEQLSVIRRKSRSGYKAGNLNNALAQVGSRYEYVCVVDSDEVLPREFLREMVAIAEGNRALGFVQSSHRLYAETPYGKRTGDIDLHWNYFLPARNLFGFAYSYGHGVLLRSKAVIGIGGFPEIVSEDIALSTKLREAGYRGYYAFDVESSEETPPSYEAFRRRNQKIVSGTLEFLLKFYPAFLRSSRVSIVEKLDLLISLMTIYLPIPFIGFLVAIYGLMPFLGDDDGVRIILSTGPPAIKSIDNVSLVLEPFRDWQFLAFMFFTVFAPLCYVLPGCIRSPKRAFWNIVRLGAIHLSVCLQTVAVAAKWLATRESFFVATGDRAARQRVSRKGFVEFSIGLGMLLVGFLTASICLMAIGLSFALVPTLIKNNLRGRTISFLIVLPVLITIAGMLGVPILVVGAAGMFAGVALTHH